MKITKEMGRACLRHLAQTNEPGTDWDYGAAHLAWAALDEMHGGWGAMSEDFKDPGHWLTALAMCAAIAGVKPEGA